jgi:hypothetical protein
MTMYFTNRLGMVFGYTVVPGEMGNVMLTRNGHSIKCRARGLFNWKYQDTLIQDAMPELLTADREFLVTGMTPQEQDRLYVGEDNG